MEVIKAGVAPARAGLPARIRRWLGNLLHLNRQEDAIAALASRLDGARQEQALARNADQARMLQLEERARQADARLADLTRSLRVLALPAPVAAPVPDGVPSPAPSPGMHDQLYQALEDRFRGDRALVTGRLLAHLEVVAEVGAGTAEAPVLDVGCGRGEWLELLRERGYAAKGIDTNRVAVEDNRARGLDAECGDGLSAMRAIPAGTIGLVTAFHVVEHLDLDQLLALLDESLRVLRPGGGLLLETPNPENLSVATNSFWLDPTHRRPVPPLFLQWLAEHRGFAGGRIVRLNAIPADKRPDLGNRALEDLLFGPHDYALVARAPAHIG
jgi:SAM-dependent methyltransferase